MKKLKKKTNLTKNCEKNENLRNDNFWQNRIFFIMKELKLYC